MAKIIDRHISYSDSECLYLDLNVISILGFHHVSSSKIERIIEDIEKNAEFPPVFLVPVGEPDELKYRLTMLNDYHDCLNNIPSLKRNKGGHHRSAAHYIENKPMKCLILKPELVEPYDDFVKGIFPDLELFPIEDITLK